MPRKKPEPLDWQAVREQVDNVYRNLCENMTESSFPVEFELPGRAYNAYLRFEKKQAITPPAES